MTIIMSLLRRVAGGARRGVGTALVRAIERLTRERSSTYLELESQVTAEWFHAAPSYQARESASMPRGSQRLACVAMHEKLLGERLRLFECLGEVHPQHRHFSQTINKAIKE